MLGQIFVSFFKIGLFTFGGGYAMLPIARKELIDKRNWLTENELLDSYSVAQLSIGIIAINTSTLIGYKLRKRQGALIAAFAAALPSIIIMTLVTAFFADYFDSPLVLKAFEAIRIAVTVIISLTILQLLKTIKTDYVAGLIYLISFSLIAFLGIKQGYILFGALLSGLAYAFLVKKP